MCIRDSLSTVEDLKISEDDELFLKKQTLSLIHIYLAGVAAGMKLNEMISSGKITADKAKMGYVGAYT